MIAVTGAAGFIGSNLATRLASEGVEVVLVDHPIAPSKYSNLQGLKGFRFIEHLDFLDLLERDLLVPEAVFHLGACSSTTETNWDYLVWNNVEYSQRIWNWCCQRSKPLIYASSAATYGDGSRGFEDTTHPSDLRPLNLYGRSKNDFDIWTVRNLEDGKPTPPHWAGVKFFNVYGPREAHKGDMASVVWRAHQQIFRDGEVKLFRSNAAGIKDGEQRRDFVFGEDCIDHMLWLWKSPHAGGLYNSGTGHARTFLDLVKAVFAALGREPRIRFIDMPPEIACQYQNLTQATMKKMQSTGFDKPATSLESGVAQFVRFLHSSCQVEEHQ